MPKETGQRPTLLLATLFFFLGILLFLGWQVANVSRDESAPSPPVAGAPGVTDTPGSGQTSEDGSWAERAALWQEVLKESVGVLKTDESRKTAGTEKRTTGSAEFVSLDDDVRPGDAVVIVWRSSDGTVWKKVFKEPLEVREVSGDKARVTLTPQQARAIEAAQSNGRVFAAPR